MKFIVMSFRVYHDRCNVFCWLDFVFGDSGQKINFHTYSLTIQIYLINYVLVLKSFILDAMNTVISLLIQF